MDSITKLSALCSLSIKMDIFFVKCCSSLSEFIIKPNNGWRPCGHYKVLNKITVPDRTHVARLLGLGWLTNADIGYVPAELVCGKT